MNINYETRIVAFIDILGFKQNERYPYHQYLDRFEDGCVGFTQLTIFQVMNSLVNSLYLKHFKENKSLSLNEAKKTILNGLNENFDNPKVFDKYKWLKDQFNNLYILDEEINFQKIRVCERNYNYFC